MRNTRFSIILLAGLSISACSRPEARLLTVAEASQYQSTSRYADVMEFIGELECRSSQIRTEFIASSVEGREIPLMILADPMPKKPEDLKNDPRAVVYIQANIHAGEVEGKEACLMAARELLTKDRKDVFEQMVVLICPILNADGNEKISPDNRRNQNGPEHGVGVRHNSHYLDLNRDGMKAESPELRGVIENVFKRWDPQVIMDMHTTNGVYRQEPVTFNWMVNPNGNKELIRYMRDRMMPAVHQTLLDSFRVENTFYGEFLDMGEPEKGYIAYAAEPRYLVNYIGLRNRLGILNENYVHADFKARVEGSYALILSLLEYVSLNKEEIRQLITAADLASIEKGNHPALADSFAIRYTVHPVPDSLLVKTYEVEAAEGRYEGGPAYRKTDRKTNLWVPYLADYEAVECDPFPYAYLITVPDAEVLENLRIHGIRVERLSQAQKLKAEVFHINKLEASERLNQGHYTHGVSGSYQTEELEFEEGTLLVRTAQTLGNLAAYLLEPRSDDGLLFWNFFDNYLVPQWGPGYNTYPVYKINEETSIESESLNLR